MLSKGLRPVRANVEHTRQLLTQARRLAIDAGFLLLKAREIRTSMAALKRLTRDHKLDP